MHTKRITTIVLLFIGFSLFFSTLGLAAQEEQLLKDKPTINVGIYVISIGNFEFTKGTYVLDFYLMFQWEDQNISPVNFEFMNGRATSKEKIYEAQTNNTSEVWYRVQASLFINPDFHSYPFDSQALKIILEDSKYNISTVTYAPMEDILGIDEQFRSAGWIIQSSNMSVAEHAYPWGEEYSQLTYTIILERDAGLTAAKLLLPPIIFCIVSGLSFFFKADKITHRLGLGTSMLISAVMFHLSQTSALPPLPSLILIDKIMIAVYAFLASSLFATTLIYVDDEYWKDVDYTRIVNRAGGALTVILPFLIFGLLYFF
ncbi:MAG TPA: hypothetical protein DSN98_04525 [Thermoplasmata archaeon]|jgi:hypothetical protein|nr:MAG TPA: hypothetical protein DSN98_04525 [Thermoplasmata archaeon]